MKNPPAADNLALVDGVLERWLSFKQYFLKAFTQEPITQEDEDQFLEIKSVVSKNTRTMTERLKDLGFAGDKVSAILRQCISVSQLRAMPIPDRRGLYKEWHSIYIHLNWLRGALELIAEGWVPRSTNVKVGTSIADIKSGAGGAGSQKKKGKTGKIIIGIIILAVIAGAVYYYLNM